MSLHICEDKVLLTPELLNDLRKIDFHNQSQHLQSLVGQEVCESAVINTLDSEGDGLDFNEICFKKAATETEAFFEKYISGGSEKMHSLLWDSVSSELSQLQNFEFPKYRTDFGQEPIDPFETAFGSLVPDPIYEPGSLEEEMAREDALHDLMSYACSEVPAPSADRLNLALQHFFEIDESQLSVLAVDTGIRTAWYNEGTRQYGVEYLQPAAPRDIRLASTYGQEGLKYVTDTKTFRRCDSTLKFVKRRLETWEPDKK